MANLKVFVAAGMPIDNPDFYMYRQSYISAHSEMTVILNNFAYFGELSRMTQFKDKSAGAETVSAGLFDYPVLMAADILLYGASYVPVGDDQKQHLELTRDLGLRMNNKFGELFTVPEEWKKQLEFSHRLEGARIRSLRNPEKKMSKSVDDPNGTIQLTDTPEEAAKKVKSAETDSVGVINWDWDYQPGITNLLQIYELLSGKSHDDVVSEWVGKERYGDLKTATAEQVANFLTTFQANLSNIDESKLIAKLEESEFKMSSVANETLTRVQRAVGLRSK
jgi:tryptophanyl-tRNA synthetase